MELIRAPALGVSLETIFFVDKKISTQGLPVSLCGLQLRNLNICFRHVFVEIYIKGIGPLNHQTLLKPNADLDYLDCSKWKMLQRGRFIQYTAN